MNTANNQRSRDTDRRIVQAVYELMSEEKKTLSRVTVRDVCERAEIHRSTFYAHYQDVYDVVEQVEKTMSVKLAETFLTQLNEGAHASACFESLFSFIAEYRDFYRLYLNETHKSGVIGIAAELFRERLDRADSPKEFGHAGKAEEEYHTAFFLHGITALVRNWIDGGCRESPHDLYEILQRQSSVQQWMTGW